MSPRTGVRRAVVALVLMSLAACAPTAASPGATPSATPAASLGASLGPTPSADVTVTMADTGRTIELSRGARFLLMLGTDFDWTVAPTDEAVIARVINVLVVQGAQGLYEALGPGTATLQATGDPPCRKVTPPCGAPSILFEVTLVVR